MAASSKQPFEISDFSGGITDNVFSGQTTTAFAIDNFYITPDKKLLSRAGSELDDATFSPIPLGNQRIGSLINYARNDKLFVQAATAVYYRPNGTTGAWSTLDGPGGVSLNAGTTANFASASEWNKQVFLVSDAFADPVKFYKDGGGNYQIRSVGLPLLTTPPTVTVGTAGDHSYVYGFVYRYDYTVWTQSFEELGPVTFVQVPLSSAPEISANTISGIPVLTNAGGLHYDLPGVYVDVYRTVNNGVNLYKVGSVPNGTTVLVDNVSDDLAQTNAQLYTNDGTLDYTPAPKAKFVHVVGNVGFYGYTKDAFGEHPYRLHQSTPGNPGFVPEITWVEVEEEVTGISSVKGLPILLGKRVIYRVDGLFDGTGRGGMNPVKIHHTAGCISQASCVEAENYLFWCGLDGFYATDGYQVIKISDHLNSRYKAMLSATSDPRRIQGKFDETNRRVIWNVELGASNLEQDSLFCLDLRYGVTPTATFTTCSGTSFRPTAIALFDGFLYRGDNNGFVFRHDPSINTDPRVQTNVAANTWSEEAVLWTFTSNHMNFGSSFFRKFVSRMLLQAANAGNTTIQIRANNDQGKKMRDLKIIRWRRNVIWGDEAFSWRNPDCVWDSEGIIEQWRRFPAGGLRLSYLQITITNGLGIITNSDTDGLCVINKSSKTAVLSGTWPRKSVDYWLKLSNDKYNRSFQVQAVNGSLDTLTLLDTGGNLPISGAYEWELFGYAKGEALNLLGFNLHWDNVDQEQGAYHVGDDGSN